MSLNEAERAHRYGTVPDLEMRWFRFFWNWGCHRFSGNIGVRQDRAWGRLGKDAFTRRIARVQRMREHHLARL
jgi:hypothetical protein